MYNVELPKSVHLRPIFSAKGPATNGAVIDGRTINRGYSVHVNIYVAQIRKCQSKYVCLPINAPSATSEAIQESSSAVVRFASGESVTGNSVPFAVLGFNLGPTGDVQPRVVPMAMLAILTGNIEEAN